MDITSNTWTTFYMEFATRLLPFRSSRNKLVDIIKAVYDETGISLPKLEKNGNVYDIDPFTTFGLFNKGITAENRIKIISSFAAKLSISANIPTNFDGIPVLNNLKATFYFFEGERGEKDIDTLWDVFTSAIEYADTGTSKESFIKAYDNAAKQKGIKWNLSMGLYWVRPFRYINLDATNRAFLKSENMPKEYVDSLPKLTSVPKATDYLKICDSTLKLISSPSLPYNDFPTLSHAAWANGKDDTAPSDTADTTSADAPSTKGRFTEEEKLEIGRQIYYEMSKNEAAVKFGITQDYARNCLRLFTAKNNLPSKKTNSNKHDISEEKPTAVSYDGTPFNKEDFLAEVYMSERQYEKLEKVLLRKKNIILQGAPGVGKTFTAKRLAYSIMGTQDESHVAFVQFHQSYTYEDFMMGYKPTESGFELKTGIFYNFCKKAAEKANEKFFFIIDEINRGNMSKIFGELLMLIENDYRGVESELAYTGEKFAVPKNLYIIGMMNTADRSLALIDYALRRRFSFVDLEPGFDSDGFIKYAEDLDNDKFNSLISCIKQLNSEIAKDKSLGKGFCIGHSYFCNQVTCTDEWLQSIVDYDILPTLSEYWFDDPGKYNRWSSTLNEVLK